MGQKHKKWQFTGSELRRSVKNRTVTKILYRFLGIDSYEYDSSKEIIFSQTASMSQVGEIHQKSVNKDVFTKKVEFFDAFFSQQQFGKIKVLLKKISMIFLVIA